MNCHEDTEYGNEHTLCVTEEKSVQDINTDVLNNPVRPKVCSFPLNFTRNWSPYEFR
jgi:hypothetical protein